MKRRDFNILSLICVIHFCDFSINCYITDKNVFSDCQKQLRQICDITIYGFKIRSEEHTSELQSRPHLVCRLLLEKKKDMRRVAAPPGGKAGAGENATNRGT